MGKIVLHTEDDIEEQERLYSEVYDLQCDGVIEPYDAYVYSMRKYNRINMNYMMKQTGLSLEALTEKLELYQDPVRYDIHHDEIEDWFPVSHYIYNKHIPRLYKEAMEMNEKYPGRFKRNIKLLKENYPKLMGLTAYDLVIGSNVIPNWLYEKIFHRILDAEVDVAYNKAAHHYTIRFEDNVPESIDHVEYGTKKKGFSKVLSALMNNEDIVVKDSVWDGLNPKYKSVKDEVETDILLKRVKKFVKEYYRVLTEYLTDSQVYEQVSRRYCDSFGGYIKNKVHYDWVKVPGLDHILRDYQRDGIGAALMNPTTFFAWGTGAGKSLGMLAAASEMKRLGICHKILMVVPNNSFENFVMEIDRYFPDRNYLIIYPRHFSQKKEYYLRLIKNHDTEYDAIIMAISSYMMLDMSKEYYLDENEKKIRSAKSALNAELVRDKYGENVSILKRKIKTLEKRKEEIKKKVSKLTDCWDQLGVDGLFQDECQEFKNVSLKSGFSYIVGVTTNGSAKCDNNVEKVHHVLKGNENSEGRVVFASATPLKNSISETYIWQKYLGEEELIYTGMNTFQDWMKNFTEAETKPGVSQDLQAMSLQTRLKYHNLTDLHSMMSTFMNYHRVDSSNLKIPKHGPYIDVVLSATDEEIEAFEQIAVKLKEWHEGVLTSKEYNPLVATLEGRAISSDLRTRNPKANPRKGTTKAEVCSSKVFEVYNKYPGTTQVVFCDLAVPKKGTKNNQFNLYDEMKKHMISLGIWENEIAYIHDADNPVKKKVLIDNFNNGVIRVLIGSTQKMGVGLNISRKLKAVHHFDCPFSASDLIQRNGRVLRAENENEEVLFFRYIKEHSYDAVSWNRVEMKQGWTEAFNSPLLSEKQRDMEDLADNSLSYGEAVAYALGKPEMRKFVEKENEVKRTLIECRKRSKELQELKEMLSNTPQDVAKREHFISIIDSDIEYYAKKKAPMTDQVRREFGKKLLEAIRHSQQNGEKISEIFSYQGFRIIVPILRKDEKPYIKVHGVNGGAYRVEMDTDKPIGCCQILNNYLGSQLKKIRDRHEKKCMEERRNMKHAWEEIEKGNPFVAKLEELQEELEIMEKELEKVS